jgi:hypothetical protein
MCGFYPNEFGDFVGKLEGDFAFLAGRRRNQKPSLYTRTTTVPTHECCGSVTFWYL